MAKAAPKYNFFPAAESDTSQYRMQTNNPSNSRGENAEHNSVRTSIMQAIGEAIGDAEAGAIFDQAASAHSGGLGGAGGHTETVLQENPRRAINMDRANLDGSVVTPSLE